MAPKKSDYQQMVALFLHEIALLNDCTNSKTITKTALIKLIRKSHAKMNQIVDDKKFREERFAATSFLYSLELSSTKAQ